MNSLEPYAESSILIIIKSLQDKLLELSLVKVLSVNAFNNNF